MDAVIENLNKEDLLDVFIRYGLYFAAIFQLICLMACIYLPNNMPNDDDEVSQKTNFYILYYVAFFIQFNFEFLFFYRIQKLMNVIMIIIQQLQIYKKEFIIKIVNKKRKNEDKKRKSILEFNFPILNLICFYFKNFYEIINHK